MEAKQPDDIVFTKQTIALTMVTSLKPSIHSVQFGDEHNGCRSSNENWIQIIGTLATRKNLNKITFISCNIGDGISQPMR